MNDVLSNSQKSYQAYRYRLAGMVEYKEAYKPCYKVFTILHNQSIGPSEGVEDNSIFLIGIEVTLYYMQLFSLLLIIMTRMMSPVSSEGSLKIGVIYFSPIDVKLKKDLLYNIGITYRCNVDEIEGLRTLPTEAYFKARNRYRAPIILEYLKTIHGYDKIIGVTSNDISTTSRGVYDWGVLGLGYCPGKSCVISTYRMKTSNKALFKERFIKIALHELGHTMGIPHCAKDLKCFMSDAEGTVRSVDREEMSLCSSCKKILNKD